MTLHKTAKTVRTHFQSKHTRSSSFPIATISENCSEAETNSDEDYEVEFKNEAESSTGNLYLY
jgi:hypothetical protein